MGVVEGPKVIEHFEMKLKVEEVVKEVDSVVVVVIVVVVVVVVVELVVDSFYFPNSSFLFVSFHF